MAHGNLRLSFNRMKMSTLPQEALLAKDYLKTHHIVVPDEWITACIDFLHDECNGNAVAPQDALNESVYEQWLNSDLHMLQSRCLPDNLVDRMKINLNGHFVLQVDEVIDVSQPAYQQLYKIRGENNENMFVSADIPAKKEPKLSRMLMLKLTDGTQTVQGMEYRSIPQLDVNTKPGAKILVHGQVQCRKGVLFLTKDIVTLLGGEVDNLKEINMPLRVLARTLGQEEMLGQLDPPTISTTMALNDDVDESAVAVHPSGPQAPETKRARLSTSGFPDDDDLFPDAAGFDWTADEMDFEDGEVFQRAVSPVFQPVVKASSNSTQFSSSGASSSNSVPTNTNCGTAKSVSGNGVTKSAETHNGQPAKRKSLTLSRKKADTLVRNGLQPKTLNDFFTPKPSSSTSTSSNRTMATRISMASNFPSDDWDDFDVACQDLDESIFSDKGGAFVNKLAFSNTSTNQAQSRVNDMPPISESKLSTKIDRRTDISTSDTSDVDILRSDPLCDVVVIEDNDDKNLTNNMSPFTTIYEIKRRPSVLSPETFVVRGFIATIISSLKPTDDGWNLPVKICDGTGQLEVVLTNELLEPMIGHKARNKQALKAMAKENPQYKEKLRDAAVNCQIKLMNLCALLELKFTPNKIPSVIGYKPVTSNTLLALQTPRKLSLSSETSLHS